MELIILGSGTCVPSLRRSGPASLIRVEDKGNKDGYFNILIDSSAGTLRQLLRVNIDYSQIDLILYTHFHPDHIGELVPYIFATKYAPEFNRQYPVHIMASEGFFGLMDGLKRAFGKWVEPMPDKVILEEIPRDMAAAIQLPPVTISTLPHNHTPHSLAYKITGEGGKAIVISGDTGFSEELAGFSRDADVLVLECSRPQNKPVEGHLTPKEAGRIAHIASPSLLVLTHFYPDCDKADLTAPLMSEYKGKFIMAEDLMSINI